MLVEATEFDVSRVVVVETGIPRLFIKEVRVLRVDTANIRVVILVSKRCRAIGRGAVAKAVAAGITAFIALNPLIYQKCKG